MKFWQPKIIVRLKVSLCFHRHHKKISQNSSYPNFSNGTFLKPCFACTVRLFREMKAYHVHVNSICVGPCVLKVFFEALTKWVRNLMESYELLHLLHLCVVASSSRVQSLNNRAHVPKDACVHKCWKYATMTMCKWILVLSLSFIFFVALKSFSKPKFKWVSLWANH